MMLAKHEQRRAKDRAGMEARQRVGHDSQVRLKTSARACFLAEMEVRRLGFCFHDAAIEDERQERSWLSTLAHNDLMDYFDCIVAESGREARPSGAAS